MQHVVGWFLTSIGDHGDIAKINWTVLIHSHDHRTGVFSAAQKLTGFQ